MALCYSSRPASGPVIVLLPVVPCGRVRKTHQRTPLSHVGHPGGGVVARWIRKDAKAERPGPSWLAPSKRHFFGRDFIPLSAFGRPRPGATAPPPRRTGASLSSSAVAIVVPNKSKGNRHSPAKRITSFAGCTGSVHSAGQPHVAVPGAGGDALPAFRCKGAASGRGADHRVPEQHRPDGPDRAASSGETKQVSLTIAERPTA